MPYKNPELRRINGAINTRRYRAKIAADRIRLRNENRSAYLQPLRDDRIWAAGHFEGEGTVTISGASRRGYTRPLVVLASTDFQVIEFFNERWPGTIRTYQPKSKTGRAKLARVWSLNSFEAVRAFLLDM